MNYSTLAEGFAQDADGTIFDFGNLYERLSGLRDSRQRRGRRYELGVILIGLLVAKLAGEDILVLPRGGEVVQSKGKEV